MPKIQNPLFYTHAQLGMWISLANIPSFASGACSNDWIFGDVLFVEQKLLMAMLTTIENLDIILLV